MMFCRPRATVASTGLPDTLRKVMSKIATGKEESRT